MPQGAQAQLIHVAPLLAVMSASGASSPHAGQVGASSHVGVFGVFMLLFMFIFKLCCVPLCSSRRDKLTKYRGIVYNILINISFIFVFPYSSMSAACIMLGNFASKATPKGTKQGEIGKQARQSIDKQVEHQVEREMEQRSEYLFIHSKNNHQQTLIIAIGHET